MRKLPWMFLMAVLSINLLLTGCESKQEKEQKAAEERHKKLFGTWDKDVEEWKKSQEKPTKPYWDRR